VRLRTSSLFSFLLIACCLGCTKNQPVAPSPEGGSLNFAYTREDSTEGAQFALWFEGNLLASDSTKRKVMYSLKYLRHRYSDSVNIYPAIAKVLATKFFAPWVIGEIVVRFDSISAKQVEAGVYTGWNSLDPSLRPDTIQSFLAAQRYGVLGFDEPYNPIRLSEIYRTLPGIVDAHENAIGWVSEMDFPLFPGLKDGELSYVFLEDGFLGRPYFYFRYVRGEPVLIGMWRPSTEQRPSWWADANQNIIGFSRWEGF
jgi:hypothetical protein